MRFSTYRNLRSGRYMLRAVGGPDDGKVIGSAAGVTLQGVQLVVAPLEAAKVRETGRRSKHAFAVGSVVAVDDFRPFKRHVTAPAAAHLNGLKPEDFTARDAPALGARLSYNPFRDETFLVGGRPASAAIRVVVHKTSGNWALWPTLLDEPVRLAA